MAKKDKQESVDPKISLLDSAAKKMISTIDDGYNERVLLSEKDFRIQSILNSELDLAKGISKGSIIDFVTTMAKDGAKRQGQDPDQVDSYNLFTENSGDLFGYFQEMYKNKYIELTDLKFITKFIPSIGEAVKTTLDSIVSSDEFSTTITRNLEFGPTLSDAEKATVQAEIERFEKDEKLLKKLKNVVYQKALVTGTHYVYAIPYNELFAEYDRLVKSGKIVDNVLVKNAISVNAQQKMQKTANFNLKQLKAQGFGATTESANDISAAIEGFSYESSSIINAAIESLGNEYETNDKKLIKENMIDSFNRVSIIDSPVLAEVLEGYSSIEIMRNNMSAYSDIFQGFGILDDNISEKTADGTYSTLSPENFSATGTYIKYIDAAKLVPIKIYNQIIGYIHIHDTTANKKASMMNSNATARTNLLGANSNLFTNSATMSEEKRVKAVQTIVDSVTDGILTNFSNRFVNKNADFKKLIGDCIVANGFVNSAFQLQFIPSKYIIAFTVNEDDDGVGQSILQDSLFPAKMLLSLIVSKLLTYMNKSGNKTIAYIRKGPIDVSTSNHVQRVIRMLQQSDITFSDLLSTNVSFHKFNRNGNIQIPTSRNGDRLIDFETQEGQDVNLDTDMERFLEKLAILGTGVPSVIMEYTDAADYAKSLVTANIKFAGRVASFQSDLEDSTTELYVELIKNSNLPDDLKKKVIPSFRFKLCRPKVLTNSNMADYLNQIESITTSLGRIYLGDNDADDTATDIRKRFVKEISTNLLPFVSWAEYEEALQRVQTEAAADLNLDKSDSGDATGGASVDDEFL